ncbi:MAG: Calx-beta domain-containing protein [Caldilineaceae bacterium]
MTALAGVDYTDVSTQVTLTALLTQTTVYVPISDDALDETDETFAVTLSDASFAIIDDGEAVVTIVDNDLPPTFTIADVTVDEGGDSNADRHPERGQWVDCHRRLRHGRRQRAGQRDYTAAAGR